MSFEIISGGVYPELANAISKILNKSLLSTELKRFANGERYVLFNKDVANKDIFIIQTFAEHNEYTVNDAFVELLLIIDAARRANARDITVVLPLFPYARQDRRAREYEAISASVVSRCLEMLGVHRIITINLHSQQTQAVFPRAFDHLESKSVIADALRGKIKQHKEKYTIIAPDSGYAKEAECYANLLGLNFTYIPKSRDYCSGGSITRPPKIADVQNQHCIIIDDMIDTGGTIISAVDTLRQSGAASIIVCTTHGIFSNGAAQKIIDSGVKAIYTTDTVPQHHGKGLKIRILSIAPLLAQAIKKNCNSRDT